MFIIKSQQTEFFAMNPAFTTTIRVSGPLHKASTPRCAAARKQHQQPTLFPLFTSQQRQNNAISQKQP